MLLGLSTAAYYGVLETEEAAARLAELPIDCAEVFLQSNSEYSSDFARVVKKNLGSVPCTSVHPLGHHENFLAQRPKRQVEDALEVYRRILDAGEALGAKTYVYHGRHTPQLTALDWNAQWNQEAVSLMCEEANARGMEIGWENVFWCQLTTPQRVIEARKLVPQVCFTLDIKQARRAGQDPMDYIAPMGERLCNVHVCDWNERGELCLPGEGVFDFELFFSRLRKIGYDGPVILEPYLKLVRGPEALHRSLAYLREKINGNKKGTA